VAVARVIVGRYRITGRSSASILFFLVFLLVTHPSATSSLSGNFVRPLLYLGNDLLRVVRMRPLVSVTVGGDRYSVGYSVLYGA
jgi:hypothetical protein